MKSYFGWTKNLDLIGPNYELTYKGKSRSKTYAGAFLTVCLFVMFCAAFYFFGKDMFERQNPITSVTQKYSEKNKIYLKDSPFVVLLVDKFGVPITDKAFLDSFKIQTVMFEVKPVEGEFAAVRYNLIVEPCSRENMTEENYNLLLKQQDPSNYLCVNPFYRHRLDGQKERADFYFQNPTGFVKSALITFGIGQCDEANNPGCSLPFKENGFFLINQILFESYLDLEDFSNPSKKYLTSKVHEVSYALFSRAYIMMSLNEVSTYEGLVFKTHSSSTFHTVINERNSINLRKEEDTYYSAIYFEVSFMRNIYLRKYVKLQEVLANVGGFIKTALLLSQLLVKSYGEYSFFSEFRKDFSAKNRNVNLNSNNQSASSLNKQQNKDKQFTFLEYLALTFSRKKAVNAGFDKNECFQYIDIFFIATKLKDREETGNRIDELPISRIRNNL